jgi:HK97 family phage major capsid protein
MPRIDFLRARIGELLEKRQTEQSALDEILKAPNAENRNLTEDETARFTERKAAIVAVDGEITGAQAELAEAEDTEKRAAAASALSAQYGQANPDAPERRNALGLKASGPMTYERGGPHSYFLDLARAQFRGDSAAAERLRKHGEELRVEIPAREARRAVLAREQLSSIRDLPAEHRGSVFEQRTNPNRTDGSGGYFIPPLWLVDDYIDYTRFGRVTANLCRTMPLPGGTDSINMPKVATGTAVGVQTADAAAVTSTDLTDTSINAPVRTIAGQQDVAMQLLDQSPIGFDEIIFADLIADYNMKLDLQVIAGTGLNGQMLGALNVSGINAVTYTDASPTLPEMYPALAQGASLIAKNRKLPATAAVMIPSLWYWATAQLDTTNRPLIVPPSVGLNPAGLQAMVAEEGLAGMLSLGLPAYIDGNIPSNLGAGTNETRIIEARWDDLLLWEGSLRTRVLTEVLSGTLQVRFQVYNYCAFMPHRRPESISVISGTGVIPAAGY